MKNLHFRKIIAALALASALLVGLCSCGRNGTSSALSSSASTDVSSVPASSDVNSELPVSSVTPVPSTAATSSTAPSSSAVSSKPASSVASQASSSSKAASGTASSAPVSAPDAYKAVLQGKADFYSADLGKNLNISQIKQAVTPDSSVTVAISKFSVVDLDNDGPPTGAPEVVLSLKVNGDDYYGFEVLHIQGGVVCGYTLWYRAFSQIKGDGTFSFSSGAGDNGLGSLIFTKEKYTTIPIAYCQSGTDAGGNPTESYFVNNQSATKDEWDAAVKQQDAKADTTWCDFTAGNIDKQF